MMIGPPVSIDQRGLILRIFNPLYWINTDYFFGPRTAEDLLVKGLDIG